MRLQTQWKEKTLAELGTFAKGCGISRSEVQSHGIPCIRYGDIYTKYDTYVADPQSHISLEAAAGAKQISYADLLFAASGETADEIGKCVAYVGLSDAYAGGDIVVLSPRDGNPIFLAHLLNSTPVQRQKSQLGQGDAGDIVKSCGWRPIRRRVI